MIKKIRAFTLIEVITVVIIISIITAFMVPNYSKTILKADERNMIANLMAIRGAVVLYTTGGGTVGAWNSLSTINTNLAISVIDPKATYACQNVPGATNQCSATHPRGWAIQFHEEHSDGLLHCSAGTCPSCPAQPGNCG